MKASFIPGDLHLSETSDGFHTVVIRESEIVDRSQRAAKTKFDGLRRDMKSGYPVSRTPRKRRLSYSRKATINAMVGHNNLGVGRRRRRLAARAPLAGDQQNRFVIVIP